MKKGRDEEKSTVPLFPRLHLNDTEKGGPRAPPRNKMALYEHLSIPSQRFKPGVVAKNSNNSANTTPPASSEPPASGQPSEQPYSHFSDSKVLLEQPQLEKKSEEDDFRVPVFMQTNVHEDFKRYRSNNPGEKLIHSGQAYTQDSTVHVSTGGNETIRRSVVLPTKTQERQSINIGENMKEDVLNNQKSINTISNSAGLLGCKSDAYASGEPGDNPSKNSSALLKAGLNLLPQKKVERHSTISTKNGNTFVLNQIHHGQSIDDNESRDDGMCGSLQVESADGGDHTSETSMVDCVPGLAISPDNVVGVIGHTHFWKARRALVNQQKVFAVQVFELHRLIKVQKLMAGSPELLHDSLLLGKSMNNPTIMNLPLDYIVKRSLDDNTSKKNGAEKPNHGMEASEKPNHRMEGSAENNVGKESLSSKQDAGQQLNSKPISINSPMTSDNSLGPWCFNQLQGQQWLIPVMSPSEGLVYKSYYPGSGSMTPFFGGFGLPRAPHMMDNFVSHPSYGAAGMGIPPFSFQAGSHRFFPPYGNIPAGMGIPPFSFQAGSHRFFPPYGNIPYGNIPVMNHSITDYAADQTNHHVLSHSITDYAADQTNHSVLSHSITHSITDYSADQTNPSVLSHSITDYAADQTNHSILSHSIIDYAADQTHHHVLSVLSPGLEFNNPNPQTCKSSSRKDEVVGVVPDFKNFQESRDDDVQVRTASSPRRQGTGRGNSSGGTNVLPLLPTSCNTRPPQVIKAVPHGGISATESAARIFQSLLEERKHHNS